MRFWYKLNISLIFCAVVIVPLGMVLYGLRLGGKHLTASVQDLWPNVGLMILGFLVIASRYGYVRYKEHDEHQDLRSELKFVVLHAKSAWGYGGGLACIATGVYFLFPAQGEMYHRFATGFGIYVSLLGLTLAVHAFYRQTAPITDVNLLLTKIIDDLDSHCKEGSRLWIVFPALNIGYYRNLQYFGSLTKHKDNICIRFRDKLQKCAEILGGNAKAITYPADLYEPLYRAYEEGIHKDKDKTGAEARIQECALSADVFRERFVGTEKEPLGLHYEMIPEKFPPHVIVIGSVTYMIMSYGLPLFSPEPNDSTKGTFQWISGERRVATVLVYRWEDPIVADCISQHLQNLVDAFFPKEAKMVKINGEQQKETKA